MYSDSSYEMKEKNIFSFVNLASIAVILTGLVGTGIYFFSLNRKTASNNPQPKIVTSDNNSSNSIDKSDTILLLEKLESQYNQENYEDCYQLAIKNHNLENYEVTQWLSKCGLEAAKIKAQANSYRSAIALTRDIPNTVPNYQEIQDNIKIWSEKILDYADKIYKEKGKEEAIKITKNLPEITNIQAKVTALIYKWEQTDREYQAIVDNAQQLSNEKAWFVAKQEIEKIPVNFVFWRGKAQPILDKANQGIKNYKPPVRRVPKSTNTQKVPRISSPKKTIPSPKPANSQQQRKVLNCEDGDIFNCR